MGFGELCKGILELCGELLMNSAANSTNPRTIRAQTINGLREQRKQLSDQIDYLMELKKQDNISEEKLSEYSYAIKEIEEEIYKINEQLQELYNTPPV